MRPIPHRLSRLFDLQGIEICMIKAYFSMTMTL